VNQFCLVVRVMTERVSRHLYDAVTLAHPRLIILINACDRNHSGLCRSPPQSMPVGPSVRSLWKSRGVVGPRVRGFVEEGRRVGLRPWRQLGSSSRGQPPTKG
jgi:hypothetical protein